MIPIKLYSTKQALEMMEALGEHAAEMPDNIH
jgi:hypothetical protein